MCIVWISDYVSSGFDVFFVNLSVASPSVDFGINSAATSVIKKANIVTLTKETATDSSKNLVTKLVAENKIDGERQETTGERVWQKNGYFGDIRTDCNMEKVNFPENSHFYVNQTYLAVQKSKKTYYADYFLLGQIIEAMDPANDIKNCKLKDRIRRRNRLVSWNLRNYRFFGSTWGSF